MRIERRAFLAQLAGLPGLAFGRPQLPDPSSSGLEHVVVVMMENRSFDHLLGWMPDANGILGLLKYRDRLGRVRFPHALAPDFAGCGHIDPVHTYAGGRRQYNHGAMNGFLLDEVDDYPIGYYTEADRPFFNALARNFTVLNRSFCSFLGPTYPNRIFLHAAQTDRLSNTATMSTLPTIWDRLAAAGVSHAYYYSNVPFLGLWGPKYQSIGRLYDQFLADAANGQLPAVAFVEPRFTLGNDGTGNDDHPHNDVRSGDAFLAQTFHALANGPRWSSTVFIITYDEWGGFFDHVPPPRVVAPNAIDPDVVFGKVLLGMRIPTIIASPWSRGPRRYLRIDSGISDHTSILKLIEWRWHLQPLTARDASTDVQNLANVLDFDRPRVKVPLLPKPIAPGASCSGSLSSPASVDEESEWLALLDSGLLAGWPLDLS